MRTENGHLLEDDGETHAPGCFPCKLATITFAPSAHVTRSPTAVRAKSRDPQLEKDRDAYRALRRNGEQPKSVTGAAELQARANESFEVYTGGIVEDASLRKRAAVAYAEMPAPTTAPKPIVREDAS